MPTSKNRSKSYSFIAYAENMDIDKIRVYLNRMHYRAAISPLHAPEPDGTDGDVELKPHYHVVINFPNPRVCDSVRDEFAAVANIASPQRVGDIRAITRYLTHMDNPEKQQFPNDKPELFGNYQYDKYIYQTPAPSEDAKYIIEIMEILNSLKGSSCPFSCLLTIASETPELVTFILRNSYAVNVIVNDFNRSHK